MGRYRVLPDWISTTADAAEPLYRQIYRQIENAIGDGRLAPGIHLPSSRSLAEHLSVSRVTVVNAYELLIADGFAETRPGSGIRVAREPLGGLENPICEAIGGDAPRAPFDLDTPLRMYRRGGTPAFIPGTPALDQFPRRIWSRMLRRSGLSSDRDMLDYGHRGGFAPLRQMIARYLLLSRGVGCDPSQVIVVSSVTTAIHLTLSVLGTPGNVVALEDPGYYWARKAVERLPLKVQYIAVDEQGVRVDQLVQLRPEARMAFVTPCHQWPTGVALSHSRRQDLLAWSLRTDAWILEDDYDSEFHFEQPAPRPLKSDPGSERVILMGSFSRTLVPSIRCAYLVVPKSLQEPFVDQVIGLGAEPSLHIQAALADFIREGHFTRHIQRVRKVYRARRDALRRALVETLEDIADVRPAAGGLQLIVDLPVDICADAVSRQAVKRELTVRALSVYCARQRPPNALHLGFAAVPDNEIEPAVRRLAEALNAAR